MISATRSLEDAIGQYDRESARDKIERAEEDRQQLLERFPRDHWPEMTLEEYALGQENSEDTFCRWMEFRTRDLGSIRGGSSRKLIIYKHKDKPGWYFPKMFENERTAWEHLRSDFIQAFDHAERGEWTEIDSLEALASGPALRLKTLHLYFPDEVLPVFSNEHLRHFLRLLKRPDDEASGYAVVQTNRNLLAALRAAPGLDGWKTKELERFLYWWGDPRDAHRVVKIAPGEKAKYWDACLQGGYICVGWEDVGDLSQFESKEAFRERFAEAYPYNGHHPSIVRKSNELWTLTELEPGDLVVANQGTSKILAVGEVVEPGYQWREERPVFQHTVAVEWDTRYEKTITAQKSWATVTV